MSIRHLAAALLLLAGRTALAQDDEASREADLFGDVAPTETATATRGTVTSSVPPAADLHTLDERLFGDTPSTSLATDREVQSLLDERDDLLDIGGLMYLRFQYNFQEAARFAESAIQSPNLLDVYFDARPTDRLRALVQGRLNYDPTIRTSTSGLAIPSATLLSYSPEPLEVLLDQLWLKLDVERVAFITIGRQRIKWGSGRTWNPTDFLNADRRNPLDIFDARTGVNLLKVHVPVESLGWNFYAVGTLDGAATLERAGGALRAELLLWDMEVALSGAARKDRPLRLGADVSLPVWDFDVHAELAVLHDVTDTFWRGGIDFRTSELPPEPYSREDDWIPQLVVGADLQVRYSDEDTIILGVEYFFNDAGYADESIYPWLIYRGAFVPFYVGRHYASAFALLAAPGSWNDTSVLLAGISNLSDGSVVVRLDWQVRVLTYLGLNAFGMLHTGSIGELRFGLDIPPFPIVPQLANGLTIAPPLFEVGAGLQLEM